MLRRKVLTLAVLLLLWLETRCAASFSLVRLSEPDALCLDGTGGAYYIYQGGQKQKFLLSFEGGGWCGSSEGLENVLDDCLARSNTDLGSSARYGAVWQQSDGILSDNSLNSYRDWTIVHLKYCDGTGHQGYKKDPVAFKGKDLYFRGHNVTVAQLNSLDSLYGLFSATDIVITGQSAGGLATYLWTNYIVDRASKSTRVLSLPDSGIFLDSTNYITKRNEYKLQFQNFMRIANEEVDPPTKECVAANGDEKWKCLFAEHNHYFIKVPLFAIQSPYDSWSLRYILGLFCENGGSLAGCSAEHLAYIEDYHANTTAVLRAIAASRPRNGFWAPSCSNHVYSSWNGLYDPAFRIPAGSANSLMRNIDEWDQALSVPYAHADDGNWPVNRPCSGLKDSLLTTE